MNNLNLQFFFKKGLDSLWTLRQRLVLLVAKDQEIRNHRCDNGVRQNHVKQPETKWRGLSLKLRAHRVSTVSAGLKSHSEQALNQSNVTTLSLSWLQGQLTNVMVIQQWWCVGWILS